MVRAFGWMTESTESASPRSTASTTDCRNDSKSDGGCTVLISWVRPDAKCEASGRGGAVVGGECIRCGCRVPDAGATATNSVVTLSRHMLSVHTKEDTAVTQNWGNFQL